MNNPQPQQVQQQRQERGGISCWTLVMIFIGVNIFTSLLGKARDPSAPTSSSNQHLPSEMLLINAIRPQDELDVLVRVTNTTHTLFEVRQPVVYSLNTPPIDLEFELTDLQNLQQNLTITALAKIVDTKVDSKPIGLHFTANFTAYKRLKDDESQAYHSQLGVPSKNKTTSIPTDFNVLIVYSEQPYPRISLPTMYDYRPLPTSTGLYFLPPIDLNQIHIGGRHYRRLPNATQNHTVKLHIFCYSQYKYLLFAQFGKRPKMVDSRLEGLMDMLQDPQAMDDVKQMLFDNNLYLVGLTLVLSVLESIFQLLAVKNEIHFWKNIEQHPGISIKSLTTQLFFTVVIVLYLYDSGASRLVIIMQLINVPVCVWKLGKATKIVRQQKFPYFQLASHSWYRKDIQEYDSQGVRYLYYVLAPIFLCYLGWKIYSKGSAAINLYSFILESLVGFIMIFGFVAMTPQLFLNFKLKSVAHLPWRMLIYRFLSTIMDDLYSFLVTMPWLWRLGCFRDGTCFQLTQMLSSWFISTKGASIAPIIHARTSTYLPYRKAIHSKPFRWLTIRLVDVIRIASAAVIIIIRMFFELEAISRRHTPYWDLSNTTGWVTATDSTPSWNYERGLLVGLTASFAQNWFSHFTNNFKSLMKHYEPPANISQWIIALRETTKLENYVKGWKSRAQYAFAVGTLDIAAKVGCYRQFNSGWQNNFAGFDYGFHRKIPTAALAFALSAPLSVAIEMAKNAYYADKTFPPTLQKGYTSYFKALTRIPFEEGPYYLFKSTYPLFCKHFMGPFTYFLTFDWVIDKMSIMWRASDVPRWFLASISAFLSVTLATFFVYPMSNATREMVDLWPKKDGICPYDGNYRKAFHYLWYSDFWNTAFPGLFKNFYWHHAPQWFLTLMLSYKLGVFNYWRVDIMSGPGDNTNEDSFI